MAKRRLTRQQSWRIRKIQQERLERARRKQDQMLDGIDEQKLGAEQSGLVIANYGASLDIEAAAGDIHRCSLRQNIEPLVVGDRVIWQAAGDDSGVVTALIPRHTLLARPDRFANMRPLAANIDQILIVAAPRPMYNTDLIDQYLVAAEVTGVQPVLLLNKIDLLDTTERKRIDEELVLYRTLGYPVIHASTLARHGMDELTAALSGKISVFAGQSGVGKSSLIKALLPESEIVIGDLSERTGLGQHTTSASRLYHLPNGGSLIDSPGVREFRLWKLDEQELAQGFVEFRPLLGHCRFRDCRHNNEPGCAILAAVEDGAISRQRLESFYRIRDGLETDSQQY